MEFDIINDILYSTVSNIFHNKQAHINFFIKEEETFKADIPRSSSRKEDIKYSSIKEVKEFNPILYENWKNKESKKRLEEAMKRLNLDENKIKSKNLTSFSTEFLVSEKGKVKNELKKYDNEFTDLFFRSPNRAEKEIMRPIYLYYKNLKSALDAKSKQNQGNNDKNPTSNQPINNNYINNNTKIQNPSNFPIDIKNPTSIQGGNAINQNIAQKPRITNTINNPDEKVFMLNVNSNNQKNSTMSSFSDTSKKPNEKDNLINNILTNNLTGNTIYNPNNNSFTNQKDLKDKKSDSRYEKSNKNRVESDKELDAILLGSNSNKRSNSQQHQSYKDKKYTKADLIQLEKEHDSIKKDQIELKQKLHNYQKEFYQQHNRKVKYYKDIIGMENEYQAYKENKLRIKQILEILEKYRVNYKEN